MTRRLIVTVPAEASTDDVRSLHLLAGDLYGARLTIRTGDVATLSLGGDWQDSPEEVLRSVGAAIARSFPGLKITPAYQADLTTG